MAAQLRVLRRRIRSTQSIKKITRAMELIATSRIAKARARVAAARPYAEEMTRVLTELASNSALDHPLLVEREHPRRAAVLVVTSDRGQCGGYNANVLKAARELEALLTGQGKQVVRYVIGRKGLSYFRFRKKAVEASWTGFSEQPAYSNAKEAAEALVAAFMAGGDEDSGEVSGVDELHLVYTEFKNMVTQQPRARRMAPMEIEYTEEGHAGSGSGSERAYAFEPDADTLFAALLPKYVSSRLFAALLDSAASESAARQRAMKAATDNANDLIKSLTLEANQARQAQITQEISEIVGGADALVAVGSEN
ncbi:MAG: F0F1 ATP synthase subunit gamma [Pseudonocardia sp.]|nr:F0F1 ATP synthase subunit gamma [Pseudonocardia sp.]